MDGFVMYIQATLIFIIFMLFRDVIGAFVLYLFFISVATWVNFDRVRIARKGG